MRNTGKRSYQHKQAQDKSRERRKQALKPQKMIRYPPHF